MEKLKLMGNVQFLFGGLLIVVNRMDTLLERELKHFGVTTKQWMLSAIIGNSFATPPTLKEVAREMGTSHQNVKQLALKLEEKGLMKLEKDRKDARITRVKMTENSAEFWRSTQPKGDEFKRAVFENITEEEMQGARRVLEKMMENLAKMEEGIQ